MPRIPVYSQGGLVEPTALRTPALPDSSQAAAQIGGNIARATGEISGAVAQVKVRAQREAATARQLQAKNDMDAIERDVGWNQEDGYFLSTGTETVKRAPQVLAAYEEAANKIGNTLPPEMQDWWSAEATGRYNGFALQVQKWQGQELHRVNWNSHQLANENYISKMREPGVGEDPDLTADVIARAKQGHSEFLSAQGVPAEDIETEWSKLNSQALASSVMAMMSRDHGSSAKAFFEEHRDEIRPEHEEELVKQLRIESKKVDALLSADGITGPVLPTGPYQQGVVNQWMAEVSKITAVGPLPPTPEEVEQRAAVEALVGKRASDWKQASNYTTDEKYVDAVRRAIGGQAPTAEQRVWFGAQEEAGIQSILTGKPPSQRGEVLAMLAPMKVQDIANLRAEAYIGKLPPEDLGYLMTEIEQARKMVAGIGTNESPEQFRDRILSKPATKDLDDEQVDQLRSMIVKEERTLALKLGHELTGQEREELIERPMLMKVVERGWVRDTDARLGLVPADQRSEYGVPYDDIPEYERTRLQTWLSGELRHEAAEWEVERAYLKYVLSDPSMREFSESLARDRGEAVVQQPAAAESAEPEAAPPALDPLVPGGTPGDPLAGIPAGDVTQIREAIGNAGYTATDAYVRDQYLLAQAKALIRARGENVLPPGLRGGSRMGPRREKQQADPTLMYYALIDSNATEEEAQRLSGRPPQPSPLGAPVKP